jgi:hypothetical protein
MLSVLSKYVTTGLLVLLVASVGLNSKLYKDNITLHKSMSETTLANTGLVEQVSILQLQIDTEIPQVIYIAKEVDKEICDSEKLAEGILSLPPTNIEGKRENERENTTQNDVVDIDGKLPTELIRLLQ